MFSKSNIWDMLVHLGLFFLTVIDFVQPEWIHRNMYMYRVRILSCFVLVSYQRIVPMSSKINVLAKWKRKFVYILFLIDNIAKGRRRYFYLTFPFRLMVLDMSVIEVTCTISLGKQKSFLHSVSSIDTDMAQFLEIFPSSRWTQPCLSYKVDTITTDVRPPQHDCHLHYLWYLQL